MLFVWAVLFIRYSRNPVISDTNYLKVITFIIKPTTSIMTFFKNLVKLGLLLFILCSISCTHYYYAPNMQNVPMLKEKKDTKLIVGIGGGDEFTSFEGQFATAVSDNIGIMGNFILGSGSDEDESGRGSLFEAGAGYFSPLGNNFRFEAFGGIGFGGITNDYGDGKSKVNFSRIFIQPSFGYVGRGFEAIVATRFANLKYSKIDHGFSGPIYDLTYIENNKSTILFEPSITLRSGWEHVKFQLQVVASENLSESDFPMERLNVSLGLLFDLSPKNLND